MARWLVGAVALGILMTLTVSAQDKAGKKPKTVLPVGEWTREIGDAQIQFTIRPKNITVHIKGGAEEITVDGDIGFSKDGYLFGRVAKVKPDAAGAPQVGDLFSFRYQVNGDKMTVSDLVGSDNQEAREAVQGEYRLTRKFEKKKKK